ncbi:MULTISPECIES: hypothetical protein [Cyanophyceae]|uniref:hypothetical protein n=1 Tax=Cyanophyceae TaxID=3028117 RepID=UPI00168A10CA|nr:MULTISPECIES: hypothetical protein [Cyanophyceae]MBD1917005.1 hypothetical protein [Phormidium sp. FACHB-77]MBD2029856.1 hypothetical protein [Phormidium sp. FACHB-322]MBD2050356.1 hypothetical protein [Leptolyngbya sp. FACHB-60]
MVQRSSYPVSAHYQPPQPQPQPVHPRPVNPQAMPPQPMRPQPSPYAYVPQPRRTAPGAFPDRPQPRQVLMAGSMAGGSMLALAALLISPNPDQAKVQEAEAFTCIRQEQPKALVSRDQIKKLLATELQAPKTTVQEFLQVPYCVLSPGKTEAGLPADREAYPLEFDPQTWLVVLYEGDRYAGYDFRFR